MHVLESKQSKCVNQLRIQGGAPPPTDQNFLNFMQFLGNPANLCVGAPPRGWRPLLQGILYPPL